LTSNEPLEPATLELVSGVNTALSCAGAVEARNDVWHVAVGFDDVIGFAVQPPMGVPPISNKTVPDWPPDAADTLPNRVTFWFVAGLPGAARSDVVLLAANWVSVAVAGVALGALASAAVIVDCPIDVELLIVAV
jgi:hypothetical protein